MTLSASCIAAAVLLVLFSTNESSIASDDVLGDSSNNSDNISSQPDSGHFRAAIPSSPVTIQSLDRTTVDPLSPLKITGHGFNPGTGAISVLLRPATGPGISIPTFAATGTTLQIIIPPLYDTKKKVFSSGTVSVQVIEVVGTRLYGSNVIFGLVIRAPPVSPARLSVGQITLAAFAVASHISAAIEHRAAAGSKLAELNNDLIRYDAAIQSLAAGVSAISKNPSQKVSITTIDGTTLSLDAGTVALADALFLSFITQFTKQMGLLFAGTSMADTATSDALGPQNNGGCPAFADDPQIERLYCPFWQYDQQLATTGAKGVQLGAKIEIGAYLSVLGEWSATGLAEAASLGPAASTALQLVFSNLSVFVVSYVTTKTPPPASDVLNHTIAQLIDKFVSNGVKIVSPTLSAVQMYQDASKLLASSSGLAPEGGLLVTAPQKGAPGGTVAIYSLATSKGATTEAIGYAGLRESTTNLSHIAASSLYTGPFLGSGTFLFIASDPRFDCTYKLKFTGNLTLDIGLVPTTLNSSRVAATGGWSGVSSCGAGASAAGTLAGVARVSVSHSQVQWLISLIADGGGLVNGAFGGNIGTSGISGKMTLTIPGLHGSAPIPVKMMLAN